MFQTSIPNNFGTRAQLYGRQFFHRLRVGEGWFQDGAGTLLLLHILSLLLHQSHLRLSGIWFRRPGSPVLDWRWLWRANTWGLTRHILALAAALRTPFGPHAMPLSSCHLNRHVLYSHPPPLPSKCACKPHSSSFCQNLLPILSSCFQPHPCYYSTFSWPPSPCISPFNQPSDPVASSLTTCNGLLAYGSTAVMPLLAYNYSTPSLL